MLGRTRGNVGWAAFYGLFVLAVAIHAPIGLRTIAVRMARLARSRGGRPPARSSASRCCVCGTARGRGGDAMMTAGWRNRGHPAYWAFLVHRLSGHRARAVPAAAFPGSRAGAARRGCARRLPRWTRSPWVEATEIALVFALAAHLTGGLRLLLIEFVGWKSESQKALIAAAGGIAAFCALAFALNLV